MEEITNEQQEQTEVPKSILQQTNEAIKKLEEQNARMENNIKELANEKLAGTSGGHVEVKTISPEEKKIADAKNFFAGTALGDAITKANG